MEIIITASKEFKEELLQHNELYSNINTAIAENDSEYKSFFDPGAINIFSIALGIGTSLVASYIKDYLHNHPKERIIVNTGEEQYILDSSNIQKRSQLLQEELDSQINTK